jgi:hypothetical protein
MFDLEKELDDLRKIADRFDMYKYFSIEDRLSEKINIDSPQVWIDDKLKFCETSLDIDVKRVIVRVIIGTILDLVENFEKYTHNTAMMKVIANVRFITVLIEKIEELKKNNVEFPEDKKQMLEKHKLMLEKQVEYS